MKLFSLKKIKPNPSNPRVIRDDQYGRLLASIFRDPVFLEKRPIVYADGIILGGNMRYQALMEATRDTDFRAAIGTKKEGEVPASWVLDASEFTEEQRRRFVIVDNAPNGMSGDWDWDVLANEWGDVDWGDLGIHDFIVDTIDRDGDFRAGTSPWERMDGDGKDGIMFTLGAIHAKITNETYVAFAKTVPDNVQEYITKVLQNACRSH